MQWYWLQELKKTYQSCCQVDVGRKLGLPQAWGGREYGKEELCSSQRGTLTPVFLPHPGFFGLETPGPSAEDVSHGGGLDHTREVRSLQKPAGAGQKTTMEILTHIPPLSFCSLAEMSRATRSHGENILEAGMTLWSAPLLSVSLGSFVLTPAGLCSNVRPWPSYLKGPP